MYQIKNNLFKTLGIGSLSLLLGYTAIYLSAAIPLTNDRVYPMLLFSFIGIVLFAFLFFLQWEQLLFAFSLSVGFQLYDPSPYEIMFFILLLLFLVKQIPFNRNMFSNGLFIMLFVFLLFSTVSIFFSINIYKAIIWHSITVYLVTSALFLVLIIKEEKQLRFFLKGYVVGAIANSLLGLIGYFLGKSQNIRLEGFFQDPNIFSPYVIIAILLVIEDSFSPKLFKSKQFKLFSIILMITAVVLAMSRAGWINLAIALTLYSGVKVIKKQLKPGFVLKALFVPFSLLVSVHLLFPAVTAFLLKQLGERTTLQYYDQDRFGAQYFTLKVAESNFFGIGPGEIASIYYMDPHNTYYRILAENGWIAGISLMLLFLCLIGIFLKRSLSRHKNEFNLELVLLCALVGTLVNISVVDALHWRHFWVLFALCYYVVILKKDGAAL